MTGIIHKDHPNDLDALTSLPHVMIAVSDLKAGHLLLDPELFTPCYSIDHRTRSPRNSGEVQFLVFNHETGRFEEIHLNPRVKVPVHA